MVHHNDNVIIYLLIIFNSIIYSLFILAFCSLRINLLDVNNKAPGKNKYD